MISMHVYSHVYSTTVLYNKREITKFSLNLHIGSSNTVTCSCMLHNDVKNDQRFKVNC